ncbi:PREDICTED: protein lin-37 homolog [Priapulus caudatus]|uniref:Protein lin-37 homolog n=1 Tax=Priapulus caudatus TaxID=37621 RepID=A0ABM1F3D2_PRICU|nr:PREDICTED: protein lin-37 homolog [Priapulus caudatus]
MSKGSRKGGGSSHHQQQQEDTDVNSARSKLGDVLLNLVLKKEDEPSPRSDVADDDDDAAAAMRQTLDAGASSVKVTSPLTSPTKRCAPGSRSARKKRKKEQTQHDSYHHTYVMKLFDRSVDLAQFPEDTPLYPICRAWMRNQPDNNRMVAAATAGIKKEEEDAAVGAPAQRSPEREEAGDEEAAYVYRLPAPVPVLADPSEPYNVHRVPSPLPHSQEELVISSVSSTVAPSIGRIRDE